MLDCLHVWKGSKYSNFHYKPFINSCKCPQKQSLHMTVSDGGHQSVNHDLISSQCCGPNTNPPSHLEINESLRQSLKMSQWENVHFFIIFYFSFLITSGSNCDLSLLGKFLCSSAAFMKFLLLSAIITVYSTDLWSLNTLNSDEIHNRAA